MPFTTDLLRPKTKQTRKARTNMVDKKSSSFVGLETHANLLPKSSRMLSSSLENNASDELHGTNPKLFESTVFRPTSPHWVPERPKKRIGTHTVESKYVESKKLTNQQRFNKKIVNPVKNDDVAPPTLPYRSRDADAFTKRMQNMSKEEMNERRASSKNDDPVTATEIRGVKYYDVHTDYTPKLHRVLGLSSRKKRRYGARFGKKKWGRTRHREKGKPRRRTMRAGKK
jgi:hypothetical protein